MKVYYSYEETGIEATDKKVYTFLAGLKEGFIKHMQIFNDKIESENGFFIIKVNSDFDGGLELYEFSQELQNELIPHIDSFNDDGHIRKIYLSLFPNG